MLMDLINFFNPNRGLNLNVQSSCSCDRELLSYKKQIKKVKSDAICVF